MPMYAGKEGVWMLYAWNETLEVEKISLDIVSLALEQAQRSYGAVGFWPFDMTLKDAEAWWTERNKTN